MRYGYTILVDGETRWSELYDETIIYSAVVGDDTYVVLRGRHADLVDPEGIRPLTFSRTPADIADPDIDAIVPMLVVYGRYYVVDRESATVAPVRELDGVGPGLGGTRVVRTDAGDVWALAGSRYVHDVVRYGADGTTTRYRYASSELRAPTTLVPHGDRVGVVRAFGREHLDLRVSVPDPTSTRVATYDYPDVGGVLGAAVLPDGRLLIAGGDAIVRSTDASWDRAEAYPVPEAVLEAGATSFVTAGDRVCTRTAALLGGPGEAVDPICTTDGLHWQS